MSNGAIDGPLACTAMDLGPMLAMVNSIFRPDGGQSLFTDYPLVYREANLGNAHLIRSHGEVVSIVPFIVWPVVHEGCRFRIGVISPTATHPDHRHRGYGLRCLRSCLARMEKQDVDLSVLWTQVKTFTFYNHAGYQGVRDQGYTFPCSRTDAAMFHHYGEQVVVYDPASQRYLKQIMQMHEGEPFGFERDVDQTATLLSLPKLSTLVAIRDGSPTAYLCISRSTNKPGIIEAGGTVEGVETLVHRALATLDDDQSILVHTSLCDTALSSVMHRIGGDRRGGSGENMMLRINDAVGFCRKIAPWFERCNSGQDRAFSVGLTDAGQTVCFEVSGDKLKIGIERRTLHLKMTRMEFASAVFGAHPARPFEAPPPLDQIFPFYFPIGVLDRS